MATERDFTGVFIPVHIWESKELIPAEKMILGEIDCLSKKTGWCTAGRAHFAEWLNCSLPNVSYYFTKLKEAGYIEIVEKPGYSSKYRVVTNAFYVHKNEEEKEPEVVNGIYHHPSTGFTGVVNGVYGGSKRGLPEIQYKENDKYNNEKEGENPQPPTPEPEPIQVEAEKKEKAPPVAARPPKAPAAVTIPEPLQTPEFITNWEILRMCPKWRKKSEAALNMALKQLSKYCPEYAVQLCEASIAGNWQGVVFAETDDQYKRWQAARIPSASPSNSYQLKHRPGAALPWGGDMEAYKEKQPF